ncbi:MULTISPECIES: NYN domain-containing protein [unclassified Vibrio]|uniref:NYN domain-containing protein n=1 Tax=Vibrio sp. HB236076 TaxID=3232307 RepID=A0AB39HDW9_9VIBR|nr:NYN domain-containing protein [Vibrio sp. HB161653]MDP5254978.1 NYN domain-containing protein [Vibrio sp. HB161653]
MENIAVFVDVQNIYYTTRDAFGRSFDYNRFWARACEHRNIVCANAYAIASEHPKSRQFHHILRGIGFEVLLKPFIQRRDGSAKGDWDVGIALDAYEAAASGVDTVVLLTGDGDFCHLVERIQQRFNTRVEVYGVEKLAAQALIHASDEYHPIEGELLL